VETSTKGSFKREEEPRLSEEKTETSKEGHFREKKQEDQKEEESISLYFIRLWTFGALKKIFPDLLLKSKWNPKGTGVGNWHAIS